MPATHNRLTHWQGGSGHVYAATLVSVEHFMLGDTSIYLLVGANQATWVGTARDLIDDAVSRSQFRRAISTATSALELPLPHDENDRMCLISDLEAGRPVSRLTAA